MYAQYFSKEDDVEYQYCEEKSSLINTTESCIIKNDSDRTYIRKSTVEFMPNGMLMKLRLYSPMGYIDYAIGEFSNDLATVNHVNSFLDKPNHMHVIPNDKVVDNDDTLQIIEHWPDQRFFHTTLHAIDSNYRIIYEYK